MAQAGCRLRPYGGLSLGVLLLLLVVVCLLAGTARVQGVQLIGAGAPSAVDVLALWSSTYRYTRDDVSLSYQVMTSDPAVAKYTKGQADFVGLDCGIPKYILDFYQLSQFPLVGQALVMAYNVPGLSTIARNLVVDRPTLAQIWTGDITMWNDTRIQDLNQDIAHLLPGEPIHIGYNEGNTASLAEVVKSALSSFSPEFEAALALANHTWSLMPPALDGRASEAGFYDRDRVQFLADRNYSLTYMSLSAANSANVKHMNMYNRANKLVEPSATSVQAAMSTFTSQIRSGDFTINIVDANGTNSWPLAYMLYVTLLRDTYSQECSNVQDLIEFVAWIQTNDAASAVANTVNFVPLDVSLRKGVIDALSIIKCRGQPAFSTNYLVGSGTGLSLFTAWSVARASSTSKMKYFASSSDEAKRQVTNYDLHYGVTSNGLSAEWAAQMPDVELMPAAVYALVPAFNLPSLSGQELVLSFEVIAAIYENRLTMWNDYRIKELNSKNVSDSLPAESIIVVTTSAVSANTQLFTLAISQSVSNFTVVPGPTATFPVQSEQNRSVVTALERDGLSALMARNNSFGFWPGYEVKLARSLGAASLINPAQHVVAPTEDALRSALRDYAPISSDVSAADVSAAAVPTYESLLLGPSAGSWPVAAFGSFIYRSSTMQDCAKARALASFFYWSQADPSSQAIANDQGLVLPTSEVYVRRQFLGQLQRFTCDGEPVSDVYQCINEGQLCTDVGECIENACACPQDREGKYCESVKSGGDDLLGPLLGTLIPVGALVVLLLVGLIVVLMVVIQRKGNKRDDWEINYSELEVGEHLGSGGFGAVHRATWKGTEVAVKVMASAKVTRDMEKSFKDEVRVMTALRHPNVVLFMAASTKAPKMCIVMEFMALGSLYDLLHNELIPDIPFALTAKMAYQASKGMHFLHSSGIVHRDLKSLNLLLDSKWNVKVSDFGLTKFREEVQVKGGKEIAGSVHWTAPEVLNESIGVDLILADVYAFGVILWELLTREQPYFGLSPAAVAVAVIRDGLRPAMPTAETPCPQEYEELITSCWHQDPSIRPTFLEIMTRLSAMHGDSNSGAGMSFTSRTSSSSDSGANTNTLKHNPNSSWTLPSTRGSSNGSSSSNASAQAAAATTTAANARAPEGEMAIVFTDITRAASLWEFSAAAMRDATLHHNETLRTVLKRHHGYEVVFLRDRNSGEGSFCMAFQLASDAVAWCCEVQQALLKVDWPEALLSHPGAAEEWGDTDDRVLFKGLRVRMGIHVGAPRAVCDPMTRRVEFIGPVVNAAARITAMTHGGQVLMSHAAYRALTKGHAAAGGEPASQPPAVDTSRILKLGTFEMPDAPQGSKLYEVKVPELEGRFFGGVSTDGDRPASLSDSDDDHSEKDVDSTTRSALQTVVGEGMMFKEDTFLTSANLCRWIIDFSEIALGKEVGLGSYGVVYRGKWKGVDVAVKRFIKQKLDERRMLEFRAEMAFLSELHHPNIVLFIGASVKKPNLCIVTEFMRQGSLKDILSNNSIKLTWMQKLRLLRSSALGINYLHSLNPVIVHRDLKPSNLLVDEAWNVKVADFGFARIKEENATMTRCGTPCWTAPEIIRGDKYDERVDVYSFGIIMWQVVTRREPYAGRNFMGVSLDVLEGRRPAVPNDCPIEIRKMMKRCWHDNRDKRPLMEHLVKFFDALIGEDHVSPIVP